MATFLQIGDEYWIDGVKVTKTEYQARFVLEEEAEREAEEAEDEDDKAQ